MILEKLVAMRKSPLTGPVDMFLVTREQARAFYAPAQPASSAPAPPPEPRQRPRDPKQELYQLMGLVPPRTDVAERALDNLISLITGFYSPELDAFYMLDEITGGVTGINAQMTIVHELTHALQDQYHDLIKLGADRSSSWDSTIALQDLMEGDALAMEIGYFGFTTRSSYRVPVCFTIPAPIRPGVPFIIERELDTWYEDGFCFVQTAEKLLPNGIAGIWERPPTSTEQILHPDKYLAGEGARPVSLPEIDAVLGQEWRQLAANDFGEFTWQNIILAGLPSDRPRVQRAAAGWGGDAWSLYVSEQGRLMQSVVAWDTPAEAREFWDALLQSLGNRGAGRQAAQRENALALELNGTTWRGQIDGDKVTLLASNDPTALDEVAAHLGLN